MLSLMAGCCGLFRRGQEPLRKVTLLMLGLENAGKTATAHRMQGQAPGDVAPTAGFSKINLKEGRFEVTIVDFGGGTQIRNTWKNYYAECHGVIFVVDSADVARMEESRQALAEVLKSPQIAGKPLLVLANKQDRAGALSEAEIIDCLALLELASEHECPCETEACSATTGSGKKPDKARRKGLCWLLRTIAKDFDTLNERIQRDTAEQKACEEQQNLEGAERVRRVQEEKEGRPISEEDDPEPGTSENPAQPVPAVSTENETQPENKNQQQSLETQEAPTVLSSQTEQEQGHSQHSASSNSQHTNGEGLETRSSATTQLLQGEENEQEALVVRDSGDRKKKNKKLGFRRGRRVHPATAGDTVPEYLLPPPALLPKNCLLYISTEPSTVVASFNPLHFPFLGWATPQLQRLSELQRFGETHRAGTEREDNTKERPDEEMQLGDGSEVFCKVLL